VNAISLSVRQLQVAWPRCTCGDDDGVVVRLDLRGVDGGTNVSIGDEMDAFRSHQINSTLNDFLVELHVGDTAGYQLGFLILPPRRLTHT